MEGTSLERLYLISASYAGRSGFYEHFYMYPDSITIARDTDASGVKTADCIVVLCTNPYGFRSGVPSEVQPYVLFLASIVACVDVGELSFRAHTYTRVDLLFPLVSAFLCLCCVLLFAMFGS